MTCTSPGLAPGSWAKEKIGVRWRMVAASLLVCKGSLVNTHFLSSVDWVSLVPSWCFRREGAPETWADLERRLWGTQYQSSHSVAPAPRVPAHICSHHGLPGPPHPSPNSPLAYRPAHDAPHQPSASALNTQEPSTSGPLHLLFSQQECFSESLQDRAPCFIQASVQMSPY